MDVFARFSVESERVIIVCFVLSVRLRDFDIHKNVTSDQFFSVDL